MLVSHDSKRLGLRRESTLQRLAGRRHVTTPPLHDGRPQCVGISLPYVGNMSYTGLWEPSHRLVVPALWVSLCPLETFCLYQHRYSFSEKTARKSHLFYFIFILPLTKNSKYKVTKCSMKIWLTDLIFDCFSFSFPYNFFYCRLICNLFRVKFGDLSKMQYLCSEI